MGGPKRGWRCAPAAPPHTKITPHARLTMPSLLPTLHQILVAGKDIKAMQFKVGLGGKNAKTVSIGELRKKGERFVCG